MGSPPPPLLSTTSIAHFTVLCLMIRPFNRRELTLLRYKPCYFSDVNYSVIMLTGFYSLSSHGQPKPHFHTEARLHWFHRTVKWSISPFHLCRSCLTFHSHKIKRILNNFVFWFFAKCSWPCLNHAKNLFFDWVWAGLKYKEISKKSLKIRSQPNPNPNPAITNTLWIYIQVYTGLVETSAIYAKIPY